MCPPWFEGAHTGAPLQEEAFISFPSSCLGTSVLAQALLGHCFE